ADKRSSHTVPNRKRLYEPASHRLDSAFLVARLDTHVIVSLHRLASVFLCQRGSAAPTSGGFMSFIVYLSGEIHTDWRDEIKRGAEAAGLDVVFTSAVTDHDASDAAGDCLGAEPNAFWRDHKSSKVNAIRTKTLIQQA